MFSHSYSSDHHRSSCDDLLANSNGDSESESDHEPLESEGFMGRQDNEDAVSESEEPEPRLRPRVQPSASGRRRAVFIRYLALLCACCLSIGSHYASYVLGPLKSRITRELGTSHTEFSLLISAYSLNSTWTPLVGGILASRWGTTSTSIIATGIILIGQLILLAGDIYGDTRIMALGMFLFGLGVGPLAVVQETIIVRFFKSHGLGVSMAFGLIVGKGASFVSARTSYPLTEKFGTRAPFFLAAILAGLSFVVNFAYILASRWLIDGAGAELEASDIKDEAFRRRSVHNISEARALEKVAAKRKVRFRDISKLGDVFWAYVGLNFLCGTIWSPFTHLAANIIEVRYGLTEEHAANGASYLLAGSVILYPTCGFLVDRFKHRPIVVQLLLLSSTLTLFSYIWLVLPPSWTQTPKPAIAAFGFGHGFSPLLLVVLVPKIVALKYVSTALGVHKSLEQTGSTIFQTFAGLALDIKKKKDEEKIPEIPKQRQGPMQHLLNIFLILNILQLISILALAYLQRRKSATAAAHTLKRTPSFYRASSLSPHPHLDAADQERPLLGDGVEPLRRYSSTGSRIRLSRDEAAAAAKEVRRGEFFVALSAASILFAWVLFLGTAWFRLGMKSNMQG